MADQRFVTFGHEWRPSAYQRNKRSKYLCTLSTQVRREAPFETESNSGSLQNSKFCQGVQSHHPTSVDSMASLRRT
jgi:hypothetical protein